MRSITSPSGLLLHAVLVKFLADSCFFKDALLPSRILFARPFCSPKESTIELKFRFWNLDRVPLKDLTADCAFSIFPISLSNDHIDLSCINSYINYNSIVIYVVQWEV